MFRTKSYICRVTYVHQKTIFSCIAFWTCPTTDLSSSHCYKKLYVPHALVAPVVTETGLCVRLTLLIAPYCGPTTDKPLAGELKYSLDRARQRQRPSNNMLEVWQNSASFSSRSIGGTVEALLTTKFLIGDRQYC